MAEREPLTRTSTDADHVRYPGVGTLTLIWALIGAVGSLRGFLTSPAANRSDFIFWIAYIACFMPWGVFSAIAFRLERHLPLGREQWLSHTAKLALASIPVCVVAAPLMRFSFAGALWLSGRPFPWARFKSFSFYELAIGEFFFWLSVGASYSIRAFYQLQQQKHKAVQLGLEKSLLEASLNQAQLEVLRAKLNPHFLFNSLQNISVLTRQDPVVASRMLAKLGDLLRAVLRTDSGAETTVADEIALLRHYIALEKMRFGDRLDFEIDVDRNAEAGLLPTFLLQPLVENAVIHGMRDVRHDGVIRVQVSAGGKQLRLLVSDNGTGFEKQTKIHRIGIGLSSTRERLERMYPGDHSITIRGAEPRGTEVLIEIPFREDRETVNSREEQRATADR
ncbi:sensor histidine kinase [Terriglobus roseus]|uniref:Histidine kinase n=1 Tax=Terriglobus roseus TaxID=392734 RepID=A0A1H4JYK6_9BACT|nr:histidine kinase [Terriglobus roseus]SEB50945.1 Histidine kinase [Terriglobus roseus]